MENIGLHEVRRGQLPYFLRQSRVKRELNESFNGKVSDKNQPVLKREEA
jgi:hypothetical protein